MASARYHQTIKCLQVKKKWQHCYHGTTVCNSEAIPSAAQHLRDGGIHRGKLRQLLWRHNNAGRVPAVLRWKFSELDMDNDGHLQLHEVRDLRRLARRIVEPQACARGLARYCDANRDRLLSLSEWLHCLQGSPVRVDSKHLLSACLRGRIKWLCTVTCAFSFKKF